MSKFYNKLKDKYEARAMIVRMMRVSAGCTWGRIGEIYGKAFNLKNAGPIFAKMLCDRVALLFDENPNEEPWN